ncbi:uncharacterized protein [Asterias amurensis]|uniref:uncharacterized protein n=1 Tax=Asterias amurensis TaxID=7602 RepID=UPI003AB271BE
MSRIQLVCVLLFLGELLAPSVNAAEHGREIRSFEDVILALTDKIDGLLVTHKLDEEMDMWHPDAYLLLEGIPLAHGLEAIRKVEETAGGALHRMTRDYIDVVPKEEGAEYVYVVYNEKWYNQEEALIADKKCVLIWRNTDQGYKIAVVMVNSNK